MQGTPRYEALWARYQKNTGSLSPAEFEEMCRTSPYAGSAARDECPECGRREHSCSCGFFAAMERESDW